VPMGDFPSRYADGENHHGHQRPSGCPQGREVSFLLVQADVAPQRGLTQSLAPAKETLQMDLALFDFDGTITDRETMPDFMLASVRPWRLAVGKVLLLPLIVGYKLGIVSGSVIRAAICWIGFRGVPVAELERHGEDFARTVLPSTMRPEALERIRWHQARGDRVVVVSGGLDLYLSHWAQAHGLEFICSSLEQRGGHFTGFYRGRQCVKAEKVRRVHELHPADAFGKVYAYGDTAEDYELLGMAHEAYYRWKPWALASAGGR
jgi:phosphatidylglycerophosphatase C